MTMRMKKTLTLFLTAALAILVNNGCDTSKQKSGQVLGGFEKSSSAQIRDTKRDDEQAKQVFDHVVENLRYCLYWYGTPDIGDGYVEGKQITALIFWTKEGRQSKVGFCAPNLGRCFATWGTHIVPDMEQMPIDRNLTPQVAFESFVEDGFDANAIKIVPQVIQPPSVKASPTENPNPSIPVIPSDPAGQPFPFPNRLNLNDYEFVEKIFILPPLGLPASILRRVVPKEAASEAKRVKQGYNCWYEGSKPSGCTGTLVFAYYNESDMTWPVLRTCSSACPPMFQGDSIQFLRRGMDGWEAYGGGGINSPKEEVARLKQKVEQAEMFRLQLP